MEMIVCLENVPDTEPWAWDFTEFNEWFNNLNICGNVAAPPLPLTAMVRDSSFIVLVTLVWSPPNTWLCIPLVCLVTHSMCMVSNQVPLHGALGIYSSIGKETGLLLRQQETLREDGKGWWERKGFRSCRRLGFLHNFHWASRGQSRFCFLTASRGKPKQRQFFSFKMDRALFPIWLHLKGFWNFISLLRSRLGTFV